MERQYVHVGDLYGKMRHREQNTDYKQLQIGDFRKNLEQEK